MKKFKDLPLVKKVGINRIVLLGVLLLMYLFFCIATHGKFLGIKRIISALNYAYFLGFLSLGVTFVIATGGIDFSIGPVMFCCALISGYSLLSYGLPMALALLFSILIGTLFGTFNGWLVSHMSVPPFIVSMASMNIAKGLASVFTKTQSVSWPQLANGGWYRNLVKVGDVPVGLIILLSVAIICGLIMNKTRVGFPASLSQNLSGSPISSAVHWSASQQSSLSVPILLCCLVTAISTIMKRLQARLWAEHPWQAVLLPSEAQFSACSSLLCCRRASWLSEQQRTIS